MVNCPECGSRMKYLRGQRVYLCEFCGFQGTLDDILRIREKRRRQEVDIKEEYRSWWLSREKK